MLRCTLLQEGKEMVTEFCVLFFWTLPIKKCKISKNLNLELKTDNKFINHLLIHWKIFYKFSSFNMAIIIDIASWIIMAMLLHRVIMSLLVNGAEGGEVMFFGINSEIGSEFLSKLSVIKDTLSSQTTSLVWEKSNRRNFWVSVHIVHPWMSLVD